MLLSVLVVVGWGATSSVHHLRAGPQLLVVLLSQFDDAVLSVELFSDLLVGGDELVDLSCELVILVGNDSNVVIHRVNFNLQVSIGLNQCGVRVF